MSAWGGRGGGGHLSSVLGRGSSDYGGCSLYLLNIQVSPMVVLFSECFEKFIIQSQAQK